MNDLDQALVKFLWNGKSSDLEVRQHTLEFAGFIWLVVSGCSARLIRSGLG